MHLCSFRIVINNNKIYMFKKIIIGVIVVIIILGVGVFIGTKISKKTECQNNTEAIFQSAVEYAKRSIEEKNKNSKDSEGFSTVATGKIVQISENFIVTERIPTNIKAIIGITPDTKFYQLDLKQQNKEKEITRADLKVGQRVFIEASEDISDKKEFAAVSVSVMP